MSVETWKGWITNQFGTVRVSSTPGPRKEILDSCPITTQNSRKILITNSSRREIMILITNKDHVN